MPSAITLRDNTHFVRDKVVAGNTLSGFPLISVALSREAPIGEALSI